MRRVKREWQAPGASDDALSAREHEFGAHGSRLDARRERGFDDAQPGVALQCLEAADQRLIADGAEHETRPRILPVLLRQRCAKILLHQHALEIRTWISRCGPWRCPRKSR